MGEDVPSIKELTKPKRIPRIHPEGVRFSKKWTLYRTAWAGIVFVFIAFVLIGVAADMNPRYYWKPVDHWSDSWTIKPGERWYHSWTIRKPKGMQVLEVNVSVSGGNKDLELYVDTPTGRIDYGRLTSPIHVEVNLTRYGAGKYTIYYDNRFSIVTSKSVKVVETIYVLEKDTSTKDILYSIAIFVFLIPGVILLVVGIKKVATLIVDDDVIEAKLVSSGKLELKVNGFRLEDRVDHAVKFRAGKEEKKVVEIRPVKYGWRNIGWEFYVDDHEVGRLP